MREKFEEVARLAHEMNRRWCQLHGDDSQPAWEDAPDWQRSSAIDGVRAIDSGEVSCPEQSHESWLYHKLREGWTYGETKDSERKTHPCMVPYEDLPLEHQAKDRIYFAVVTAMLGIES